MSEESGEYKTNNQPDAIIEPPRTVKALLDGGIVDYQVWGWVKTSAKFRKHIKILRGAKHDIWHYLALGVDETGKCKETIKEICEGTGYSHTEVINTLRELDEMGYLSVQKDNRGNTYLPEFVARGAKNPTELAVKKVESTPVYQVESTPPIEELQPIPLRVKRVNTPKTQIKGIEAAMYQDRPVTSDDLPEWEAREKAACDAFESAFGIDRPWNWYPAKSTQENEWAELRAYLVQLYEADNTCFVGYATWANDKYSRGAKNASQIRQDPGAFPTAWAAYKASEMYKTPQPKNPETKYYTPPQGEFVPAPEKKL